MMDHGALAVELYEAERSTAPIQFLTERYPDLDWNDARKIARATDALRRSQDETQIGWKLGWTSEAMRLALGIDQPNWGTLWRRQFLDGTLDAGRFIHPKVEPELVWRCPKNLSGELSASEIADAGGQWALGLEIVDPRFPSFDFDALDNTADNSSSAAIQIGAFSTLSRPPSEVEIAFTDSFEVRRGLGSQAMGSPFEAISWLVGALFAEGLGLEEGQIVFTGGLAAPFDVTRGCTYRVSSAELDHAEIVVPG